MPVRSIVMDSSPAKHSVHVNWFQRDPGGGTLYVMPAPESCTPPHTVTRADEAGVSSR